MSTGNEIINLRQANEYYKDLRERSAPIIFNGAIGNPIRIEDGADNLPLSECKLTLLPKQNLNEQEAPYPPGCGKNLFHIDSSVTQNGITAEMTSDGLIWVHGTPDIVSGYVALDIGVIFDSSIIGQNVAVSIDTKDVGIGFTFGSSNGSINFTMSETATSHTGQYTKDGATPGHANINVNYDVGTIDKKYKLQVEIGSEATAWSPYSNICPIIPWENARMLTSGKNILKNIKYAVSSTTVMLGQNKIYRQDWGTFLPAGTYTISASLTQVAYLYYRNADNSISGRAVVASANPSITFTTPIGDWFAIWLYSGNGITPEDVQSYQLEIGSAVTAYETPIINECLFTLSKNIFDKNATERDKGYLNNKYLTNSGVETDTTNYNVSEYILIDGNRQYTISSLTGYAPSICFYDRNKAFISGVNYNYQSQRTFVTPANAVYCRMSIPKDNVNTLQLESGTEATEYESFSPPVYGCKINLITGEVWGTYGSDDLGSLDYSKTSSGGVSAFRSNIGAVNVSDNKQYGITSVYPFAGTRFLANMPDKSWMIDANGRLYIRDDSYSDTATFKPALIGQRIAYELETPVLLATLSPQELRTLLGTNTIWSDADSIDIEYRADTGLFINKHGVKDVLVDNASILGADGVANIPLGTSTQYGVFMVGNGLTLNSTSKKLQINPPTAADVKGGTVGSKPITPSRQHESVFYALSKLAGVDLANGSDVVGVYPDASLQAIQKLLGMTGILGPYEDDITADQAYAIGDTFIMNGKRYKATAAIAQGGIITVGTNCELCPLSLSDIQINGQSIIQNGIANIPLANGTNPGAVIVGSGLSMDANGKLYANFANSTRVKAGTASNYMIGTDKQHESVFYALAKLAGADMASVTGETIGVYPQAQKTAIQSMLGIEADIPLVETVSGSTPSITGMPNVRYICGEVSLLTITPPASGTMTVRFESGSTATVLTVPNTVKFPAWFDPTSLATNTTYEIMITDGVYGAVMSWA